MARIALKKDQRIVLHVNQSQYPPTAKEVLNYFFKSAAIQSIPAADIEEENSFSELSISSRPQIIKFSLSEQSGVVEFSPGLKQTVLSENQIQTVLKYGYLIHKTRLICVHEESVNYLRWSRNITSPKEALLLSSELRKADAVQNSEFSLVENAAHEPKTLEIEKNQGLRCKLYPYQRKGVQWLLYCYFNKIGTLLGDDMGLGKTVQIISVIAESWSRKLLKRALIVVPNSLIENWKREFESFFPEITPFVHAGEVRDGLAESISEHSVILVPYSLLAKDIEMLVDLEFDLLVFDEASLLKNPDSARTKAAHRLNRKVTIAMTGTPVENSLIDVWSILNITNPDYLEPLHEFKRLYTAKTVATNLDKDLSVLNARIKEVMLRRMKKDILKDLPEKLDIHQALVLSTGEKAKYEKLKESIRGAAPGQILKEITRLRQFTSHPILLEDFDRLEIPALKELTKDSSKLERLFELLDEIESRQEKVLIFCNYVQMISLLQHLIMKRYEITAYKIDGSVPMTERQISIDNFSSQTGFSAMVLNPTTAGMGLNITAANHVVHYSRQWNPALEIQATARAFRNGQTREVNVYYLYYVDTIEEIIDQRLRQKHELSSSVIEVVDDKFANVSEQEFILNYIRSNKEKK